MMKHTVFPFLENLEEELDKKLNISAIHVALKRMEDKGFVKSRCCQGDPCCIAIKVYRSLVFAIDTLYSGPTFDEWEQRFIRLMTRLNEGHLQ